MREKYRGKLVTKAPGVSFVDVHPTRSAGKKFKGEDLPPSQGSTGKESDFVRCQQCGYPVDRTLHSKGSGHGNESVSTSTQTHPITGATLYYGDPTVTGGCPFCGSSEYE